MNDRQIFVHIGAKRTWVYDPLGERRMIDKEVITEDVVSMFFLQSTLCMIYVVYRLSCSLYVLYIHTYMYVCICVCVYIYIYIYILRMLLHACCSWTSVRVCVPQPMWCHSDLSRYSARYRIGHSRRFSALILYLRSCAFIQEARWFQG